MSNNAKPANFVKTLQNPEGGEWPELSEAEADHNVEFVHARFMNLFNSTIRPRLASNCQGNTKATAEVIAALFLGTLHNFLAENCETDEDKRYDRISESVGNLMDYSLARIDIVHKANCLGLPQSIINVMLHGLENDREEKPLPEELRRLLDL